MPLSTKGLGPLLVLAARGPRELEALIAGGLPGVQAEGEALLQRHPQIMSEVEIAVHEAAAALGMPKDALANVLDVALPALVRRVGGGTVAAVNGSGGTPGAPGMGLPTRAT
jgi:hypothetical protein